MFTCFAMGLGSAEALREWEPKRNQNAKKLDLNTDVIGGGLS